MTSTPLGHPLVTIGDSSRDPAAELSALRAAGPGWFIPTALAVAALALGLALQVNFGQYHPAAMPWLTLALLACVAAAVTPKNFGRVTIVNWRPDQLVLAVALSVQFALLWVREPAATLKAGAPDDLDPFRAGVALSAALVAVGVSRTRAARVAVPMLLLAHFALGVWVIRATPSDVVDVQIFQRDASDALLHGINPYTITFPDIYGGKLPVYGPGLSENGRLNFGYPYPPFALTPALVGRVAGDFRYGHLLALTLAGALIAYTRPGARSVAAAAMLLFTPRGFFVVEAGWTEPLAILMLAATVFAACRAGRRWGFACAVALGLFLASKQYLVLALPLVLLLPASRPRGGWIAPSSPASYVRGRVGMLAVALLVAAAVSLPLALWDVGAFMHSAVTLQFHQPFRADALSYLVPLKVSQGTIAPWWTAFAFAAVAGLLALWRCPRTPAGFSIGVALVLFAFFATSKQAFCNYYVLVLAALCCALAATPGLVQVKPARA